MLLLSSLNNYASAASTISHFSCPIHEYNEQHRCNASLCGILIITFHPLQELFIFSIFFSSLSVNYLSVIGIFYFPKKSLLKPFWKPVYTVMNITKLIDITKNLFKICRAWLYSAKAVLTFHRSIIHSLDSVLYYSSYCFALYKSQMHSDQCLYSYRLLLKTFVKITLHKLSSFPVVARLI